jgi:hypothetical protein
MTDTSGLDALGELSSRRTQMIIIAGQRRLKNGHFKQNLQISQGAVFLGVALQVLRNITPYRIER